MQKEKICFKIKKRCNSKGGGPETKCNVPTVPGQKRTNPFADQGAKRCVLSEQSPPVQKSVLLNRLNSVGSRAEGLPTTPTEIKAAEELVEQILSKEVLQEKSELKYINEHFPLDWSLKQKVQFTAKEPLFCNVKATEKARSLVNFASSASDCNDDAQPPHFYQHLCNWIHPVIPGLPNFPLKRTMSEKAGLTDTSNSSSSNISARLPSFHAALLEQWKTSFQSLFIMLRSNMCPFFYVCGHQFSILFLGRKLNSGELKCIITPSTKGLRRMLLDEGIPFEFTTTPDETLAEKVFAKDKYDEDDADTFLEGLGLDKDEHLPNMEEQKKLSIKAELNRLDNRPESTIQVTEVQGFFNFFLNSSLLGATSGKMLGVPPTLISPVVFEGAVCKVNKYVFNKIKHSTKTGGESYTHCLDVYGTILPTQIKSIVDLLAGPFSAFEVRTKEHEKLFPFNTSTDDADLDVDEDDKENDGDKDFLLQKPLFIPDQVELKYEDKLFKF